MIVRLTASSRSGQRAVRWRESSSRSADVPLSLLRAWWNVLVQAEEVGWIVFRFKGAQAVVVRPVRCKHGGKVVEIYIAFAMNADALIADDCVHPSDAGHAVIRDAAVTAF